MFGLKGQLWMGYMTAYDQAVELEARALAMSATEVQAAMLQSSQSNSAADALPRLYSRNGDVGVITISGPMVNTENFITEMLGMSTYPAIQRAAAFAAMDTEVKSVLLDINSGGGSVAGVETTSSMIKQLKAIKPVTTYTDGTMASAAYWLGSSADKAYASPSSIVGSIGCIAVHAEISQQLKNDGVNVTIVRSGENKALGHPAEPFSAAAQANLQNLVNKSNALFEQAVAENRNMSLPAAQKAAGQGQEYFGADAQAAGLIDGVMSVEQVYSKMAEQKSVDNSGAHNNNRSQIIRGSIMKPRTVLTKEQVAAAIAAGADAVALEANNDLPAPTAEELAAEAKAVADAKIAADAATAQVEADAAAKAAADATAAPDAKTEAVVALLKEQAAGLQAEVVALKVAAKAAEDKFKVDTSSLDALRKIAADSINKMTIALSGTAVTLDALTPEATVTRHAEVSADFFKNFKVGGVASTAIDLEKAISKTGNVSSLDQARVNSARTNKGSK